MYKILFACVYSHLFIILIDQFLANRNEKSNPHFTYFLERKLNYVVGNDVAVLGGIFKYLWIRQ